MANKPEFVNNLHDWQSQLLGPYNSPQVQRLSGRETDYPGKGLLSGALDRISTLGPEIRGLLSPMPVTPEVHEAIQYQQGLLDGPLQRTEIPPEKGAEAVNSMFDAANPSYAALTKFLPGLLGMTVYHGSPHKFNKFDLSKIGTGEGAQAYGHGLYLAENPSTAKFYAEELAKDKAIFIGLDDVGSTKESFHKGLIRHLNESTSVPPYKAGEIAESVVTGKSVGDDFNHMRRFVKQSDWDSSEKDAWLNALDYAEPYRVQGGTGNMYEVDLPDTEIEKMLDWDRPLSEQSEIVKKGLRDAYKNRGFDEWQVNAQFHKDITGQQAYTYLSGIKGQEEGSYALHKAGIPGIKYLDGSSRSAGQGTRNFVVFDDNLPKITKRNNQGLLEK